MTLKKGVYEPTAEHRRHISETIKEWWAKPENRERMSLAHKGSGLSGGKGWHHTEEAKRKISLARTGKPHPYKRNIGWKISKEGRKHMSQAMIK